MKRRIIAVVLGVLCLIAAVTVSVKEIQKTTPTAMDGGSSTVGNPGAGAKGGSDRPIHT